MKKISRQYSNYKKREYDAVIKKSKEEIAAVVDSNELAMVDQLSRRLTTFIQTTSELDLDAMPMLDDKYIENITFPIYHNLGTPIINKTKRALREHLDTILKLGTKHTVLDRLYNLDKVRDILDNKPTKFFSFDTTQLTEFVIQADKQANFSSFDELSETEKRAIIRADAELQKLTDSLDSLEESGDLDKFFNSRRGRIARMSYEERYRFLYLIYDIDNFVRRADASRYSFISDTYVNQRHQVLAGDIGSKYDTYIKARIAKFLKEENRYLKSIKNKEYTVEKTTEDIRKKLIEKYNAERKQGITSAESTAKLKQQAKNRAQTIVSTESSIAYNFGKLIGFSSLEDLDKRFIWNNDWELEQRDITGGYEVCDFCESMGGNTYTVRDLLLIGTQLDRGFGRFGVSGRSTDFKNPSLPMIPAHPNCSCYWTLDDSDIQLTSEQIYQDVPISSVRQLDPEGKFLPQTQNTLITSLVGAGLIVGSAFLLSRSNYWNTFFNSIFQSRLTYIIPRETALAALRNTIEYSADVFDDDIVKAVVDTTKDATESAIRSNITVDAVSNLL